MDIMTGLLVPVLAVTLVGGQLDVQFDNSTVCVGETLYASCTNLQANTYLEWHVNDSFSVDFGLSDGIGEDKAIMINGRIIAIGILTTLVQVDSLTTERAFFNISLTITNSTNNTQFYCQTRGAGGTWTSPTFNIVRFGTPSAPENLTFNGTVLSWDRPAYIGGTDLSHYQVSYNGSNQSVIEESLATDRANPIQGNTSVFTINACGQSSEPTSLPSLESVFLPLLSNPKTQWYCHQPLDQGRQVIIRWDVDTTGVSLPVTWQASNDLSCNTDDSSCTGRFSSATQIKLRVDNRVITDTYSVDIVPDNALFLDSGHNSVIVRLNPDCKPMVYKVDITPCGVMAKPGDDSLELRPGQSQELPVTTSCIEASLLSDGHVIESANITLELSGAASAPALGLPLLVMLGSVVLPQLAEVIQGR